MAVYARGYRPYASDFRGPAAFLTIWREGYRTAARSRGFRIIGILFLIWFVVWSIALYSQIAAREFLQGRMPVEPENASAYSARVLSQNLASFYTVGISTLTALLAMLVGSGLIADDLRTRALTLYLVRPLRPVDYVLGKALVLPGILAWMTLAPGLAYLLLVAFWQEPGEEWTFLADNADVAGLVVRHFLVASASYVGLMLFLSSRTPRRGAVASLAAAVIFGGTMLHGVGSHVRGGGGDLFRMLSIPLNTIEGFARRAAETDDGFSRHDAHPERVFPDPEAAALVAVVLLVVGAWAAYRRARSVEVSG
jgi:hypothetical protein